MISNREIIFSKLDSLSKSKFRSSFKLKYSDKKYIYDKGIDKIIEHAYNFVRERLASDNILNDGKQTPMKGHPVFISQHATGTCCRDCLYKWHGIKKNKRLTNNEINYIVSIIMEWINREIKYSILITRKGIVIMKKIYIIQMDTKTLPARLISFFTMYKYSHVAISFNRNCEFTYSFGRKNLYSILNAGFVMENKKGKFFKRFRDTKCRIYEINVSLKQYNDLVKIIKYMKKNRDNYGYDYLGIILRYLRIPVTFKNKYVCSYFIAELLEEANVCNFNKETCFVGPRDFEKMNGFNLIYTGKYAMYR